MSKINSSNCPFCGQHYLISNSRNSIGDNEEILTAIVKWFRKNETTSQWPFEDANEVISSINKIINRRSEHRG